MRPPSDLPSTLVALAEAFARRAGIAPDDLWDYVYKKRAPPPELRAAIVEALFPAVSPNDFLLPLDANDATLATDMSSTTANVEATPAFKKARAHLAKGNRRHPFVDALVERHLTIRQVAKELGYARTTVQSWYDADGNNGRPIPREAAETIRKRFGVPLKAWSRIVD